MFPLLIAVAVGMICLFWAVRAGGTKNIVSAYAQGQLDTASFLKRVDARARASLHFRASVICLAVAILACVFAAAFPGQIFAGPFIAALLTVVLLRFAGVIGYRAQSGGLFDALVPDAVVRDMTASAGAMTRFRTGWTLAGRVAVLRRAAALRPDLPQEVRQIVLAQYSPQAIFVPVRLQRKSIASELRLMLAGWRASGGAMALAAILALAAVTLLPRDLLRLPALNGLELPDLPSPPEDSSHEPDKPADGQEPSGNDSAADQSDSSGGASGGQGADGAGAGDAPAGRDGGDVNSGQDDGQGQGQDEGQGGGGEGQGGQSSADGTGQGQSGEGGTQAGKDAAQQDGNGGAGGDKPDKGGNGADQAPGPGQAADTRGAGGEASEGGQGQDGQAPGGQSAQDAGQPGAGASPQGGQGASDAAGADGDKPDVGENGEQAADQQDDGARSQTAGGREGASGDSTAGESSRTEATDSGDPGGTASAGAKPEASSSADASSGAGAGWDANESQAEPPSDAELTDAHTGEAHGGIRKRVDELPDGARIIETEQAPDEADRELQISPPLADPSAETSTETMEMRQGAQPPRAEVTLELKAGGPAALFAEQGEVPDTVEARLLPDEPVLSSKPPVTPGAPRQILPAWIDELMK